MIKTVLFDWNGTLLDDVAASIQAINSLLHKRGMKPLASVEEYRERFGFPVIDYYRALGFDFKRESFEQLSEEFIRQYDHYAKDCQLMDGSRRLIEALKSQGVSCCILSASKQENLLRQVRFYQIETLFDDIIGIDNIYAASKLDRGRDWIRRSPLCPEEILMIGDTLHDAEVARCLKTHCVLIAAGHQSRRRLEQAGVLVLNDFSELDFKRFFPIKDCGDRF